jgi:3-hexulose-6-phosphate synthase/6-phospho-3-hexuloisomerase
MRESSRAWPQVQIALDFTDLDHAVKVAKEAESAGIRWIEAGTPLIKSEGMKAVKLLRKKFPDATIVADMKTLDAGLIEAKLGFNAGADVVSVSGLSHRQTILDSVSTSEKYDGRIMVDLLMTNDPIKLAQRLERLGVHLVCFHIGIDAQQAEAAHPKMMQVRSLVKSVRIPVAVAGGVNSRRAEDLVRAGAKIVIVGGWIAGSKNPYRASKMILNSVYRVRSRRDDYVPSSQ